MKIFKKIVFTLIASLFIFAGTSFAQTKLAADAGDAGKTVATTSVPANCSAFSGVWIGRWDYGSYGEMRLEVAGVDANCIANGNYGENNGKAPWPYAGAEIKGDKLSWVCNPARQGTCTFEHHGETLWAGYRDGSGGRNNGVFKKAN